MFHLLLECCILFWLLVSQWVIINTVSDSEIHDNWSQRVWSPGICAFIWRIHRRDIDRVYTWIRYRYNDLRFLFLLKMKMLPPSWLKKIFWGICFLSIHWKSLVSKTTNTITFSFLFPPPPKIFSFVLHGRKKVITCLEWHEEKWWQNFHFWTNYPLKLFQQ